MRNNIVTKNITLSAIFLSLSFVLPFLTGQIPEIGSMLCPMHIPVILCGFICGWKYGLMVGFISPLLRTLIIGIPSLVPTSICMAFELASYGLISAIMFKILPKTNLSIYLSLLITMISGRIIWGISMFIMMGFNVSNFGLTSFFVSAFVNAVPGIIIQIVFIPLLIMYYNKIYKKE